MPLAPANRIVQKKTVTVFCFLLCIVAVHSSIKAQKIDTSFVAALRKKAHGFLSINTDSMRIYSDSARKLAQQIHDEVGIAGSYQDLANYNWIKGNYTLAIQYYDTSNQIFVTIKKPARMVDNYTGIGLTYSRLGDYPKAIEYLFKGLSLAEKYDQKLTEGKIYNSIGIAYKNQGNFKEALISYRNAYDIFKQLDSYSDIAGYYANAGNLYTIKKEYDSALQFHSKALHIFDSLKIIRGVVTCYNNLSDIYTEKKNYKEALDYRLKSLDISRSKGFFPNEVSALLGLASIYTELGNYSQAEKYFHEGIEISREKKYRSELVNLYHGLSICYKKLGKSDKALNYFEKYASLKDSLINEESLVRVSNLQNSYQLDKKEASIQLLKKDNEITKLNRNRTIFAGVALLLIAGLTVALQRNKIVKNRLLLEQQTKLHETEQALSAEQLKIAKLKEEELLKELEYKNKALTTYALSMVQKNEMLEEVKESVELLLKKPDNQAEHFKKLSRIIDFGFTLDKDWDDFKLYFEEVHTDFFTKLKERFPDLGGADLKLCALIRLNLNMKQASTILRISPDSVKVARYRLRKKFNLQTEDNLTGFIMSL